MSKVTSRSRVGARGEAPLPARPALAREQLVNASLEILQTSGLDALSTRALAGRLGVKSPALYWHVRNKDELLALIADAICGQMTLPESELPARERLEAIGWEYRRVLLKYRDAPRLISEQPPIGPHRMRLYDVAVGALHDLGFRMADAITTATFYRNYLLGMIAEEARQKAGSHLAGLRPAHALGAELSRMGKTASDYPNLRGAAEILTGIQPEEIFRAGLEMILDGMAHHVGKKMKQRTGQRSRAS